MEFITYERKARVAIVTLNRPERLNALGTQVRQELAQAWKIFADDREARVAILTGAGRAFSAGMDIKDMAQGTPARWGPGREPPPFHPRAQPKPVVAAVNGFALGAGFDLLAMGADVCIASDSAVFGMPEVVHGLFSLGTPFAVHRIPLNIIMEIVLGGDNITAQRAYEIGVVNKVVPSHQLMPEALKIAERIATHPPLAVSLIRQNLLKAMEVGEKAYILEHSLRERAYASKEAAEGATAFVEKRKPVS